MATVPLLSSPIKLPDSFIVLVFDNFLSSVIRSASGSCCTVRAGLEEVARTNVKRHSWLKLFSPMVGDTLGSLLPQRHLAFINSLIPCRNHIDGTGGRTLLCKLDTTHNKLHLPE